MRMRETCLFCAMGLMILLVGGCASYQYNLVQPAELSRHIGAKTDQTITIDPLQYRLRTVDNRLVMRIYNQSGDPIELNGAASTVVDPDGQSHPLRSQTIAPDSFIKLIFPPLQPKVYGPSPAFGVGMGYGWRVDATASRRALETPAPLGVPRYCAVVVDPNDTIYWDWKGAGGEMRLMLVFTRKGSEFRQAFLFRRQKM
jgi:hypothetical protein